MAAFEDVSSPDLEQFKGGKWTDWLDAVQSAGPEKQLIPDHASKRDVEVARLGRSDMSLFGYRPANDKFYLVTCEHCGHLVKPQSLSIHFERRHRNLKISTKPSTSRLSAQSHVKSQSEQVNHNISHASHSSRRSGHVSSHQKSSERVYSKNDSTTEKQPPGILAEKERRRDGSLTKTYRTDSSGSKSAPSLQTRTVKSSRSASSSDATLAHYSSSKKSINKPGGTIQLEDIPEPNVVKSTRPSSESGTKHFQKVHRSSKYADGDNKPSHLKTEKSDSYVSTSKLRNNHDSYHHHLHNAPRRDSNDSLSPENSKLLSPNGERKLLSPSKEHRTSLPHVVLQKSAIVSAGGKVNLSRSNKRVLPNSGGSDSSVSPSRNKIPTSHNSAKEKEQSRISDAPAPKVRKKDKILPLKAREYDPNKHCGVWVKDDNAHCRRSLTCKVHPLSAKRLVTGRIKPYDELVQEHGREKQRLKEKALLKNAVSPMPPPPSPSVQSIMSPPVLSPAEFAVPSPATKSTPLSPPYTPTSLPTSQSHVSKAKPSVSLFPRIYAAWHVDCWDNDEVVEDASTKLQSSCYCIQRQPQPLMVLNSQARRSANCQVSYCRKTERQLEAISSNFEKFSIGQPKKPKPFSFTPISGARIFSSSKNVNTKQKLQKKISNPKPKVTESKLSDLSHTQGYQYYPEQTLANVNTKPSTISTNVRVKQNKTGTSTSMSRKFTNATSTSVLISSVKQIANSSMTSKPRSKKISGQVVNLMRNSSVSDTPTQASKVPGLSSASPILLLNSLSPSVSPSPNSSSSQSVYSGTISPALTLEGPNRLTVKSSKSAVGMNSMMQTSEEKNQLVVQLPNGLKSLPGNFFLKQRPHSVTLSGNIGALTVPTDHVNFMGSQIPKTVKTINSNNNFTVQGDGTLHLNTEAATITKLLTGQHTNGPVNVHQPTHINAGNILMQNDESVFLNQHCTNNQNQQFPADNLAEALASLDAHNDVSLENSSAANDLIKLLQPETCDRFSSGKMESCSNTQLPNLHQIDASILGQVLATSNNPQVLQNQMNTIGATRTSTNASLNTDLSQKFITR